MASGGTLVRNQSYTPPAGAPSYLVDAMKDIGMQEWVLDANRKKVPNPNVVRFIEKVAGEPYNSMTTPWCAYYVGAKLEYNGYVSSKSGAARSYLNWGQPVADNDWKAGDIVVFRRLDSGPDDHIHGHVAFLLSWDAAYVYVLGGNQGDKVSIQRFRRAFVIGVRRPRSFFSSKTLQASAGSAASQATAKVTNMALPDTPDASVVTPAHVDASSMAIDPTTLAPVTNTPQLPAPEDLQAAYDQAHPYLSTLSHFKPEIVAVLTLISLGLALYAGWYRYLDWKKGRT